MSISLNNLIKFAVATAFGVLILKIIAVPTYVIIGVFLISIFLMVNFLRSQTYRTRAEWMLYFALFWAIIAFPYVLPYIPFFTGITAAIIAAAITFLTVIIALVFIGNKIRS